MERQPGFHQQVHGLDNCLAVLRVFLSCVKARTDVTFGFDVRTGTYVADLIDMPIGVVPVTGSMNLAIYNDLKLSQFILESDSLSRPDYRWFTLTDRGRKMAER